MATATTATLHESATVFVVKNILDSVAYYRETLGFTVAFLYGDPTFYAGVCRDNVTIHLQQAGKTTHQAGQGGINIFVDDVDKVYEELKARNARINKPPADYPYGMRDFDLNDPDGNFLCFGMESPQEMKDDAEKPHYHGHRDRLRQRFRDAGAGALADYELLELILFAAIPRRDVKPLAKALIDRFGSFGAVVGASRQALADEGLGDAAADLIKATHEGAIRLTSEQAKERPVLGSWQKVLDYCRARLAHSEIEEFHLLFLDRKNGLIAAEPQQKGTVDHTPVYPREVVKRALELGASAIILVHNHPSGDPSPSKADIDMTREVARAASALGIALHDHLIVGRQGHASLKGMGLI